MFVRHGDKGIEMKLLELENYTSIAQNMLDNGLTPLSRANTQDYPSRYHHMHAHNSGTIKTPNSGKLTHKLSDLERKKNGTLFITTEDQGVLNSAEKWSKENGWDVIYTNLFDRTVQTAAKTWDEQHKGILIYKYSI